jgi:hypothetical protein
MKLFSKQTTPVHIFVKSLTIAFFFFFLSLTLHARVTYYVSPTGNDQWSGMHASVIPGDGPLASLPAAVEKIRADFLKTGGSDYRIVLREGVYPLHEVIRITPEDGFRLSFESYPGEKAAISAGRQITGWKKARVNGKTCWKVNLQEVKDGDFYFRQLFVNGQRANRPRLPKSGFYEVENPLLGTTGNLGEQLENAARDRFIFREGDIHNWKNLQDVNVMVLHYWQENYLPIKEVDMDQREVVFTASAVYPFIRSHPAHVCGNAWYYADNVFEALDSPGEWYIDRPSGDLYYIPRPGEKINETSVFAPLATQLFVIEGSVSADKHAANVHFKGLVFRHSEIVWDAHQGTGNNFDNSGPALIKFSRVKDCSVSECLFSNLGEYAIEVVENSERVYITGNHFSDLAAGAIKMRSGDHVYITDNEIHEGGRIFHGAPAVLAHDARYCRFLHNHISDFYFNGIVCIGGRASLFTGAPGAYDNHIMNNHIHKIGHGWLSDMGGIKVAGLEPGMIISGNVVHDVYSACYGGNAVYMDAASQHVIVENNLLYNTNSAIINVKGRENIIRNNIMAFGEETIIRRACPFLSEMDIANVYKNVMLVNNQYVHRTRDEIPIFTPGYWSDLNVIWNIGDGPIEVQRPYNFGRPAESAGIDEWIARTGNDRHSILRDPLFRDPLNGDFTLSPESFVYDLGIKPLNFDNVGPRPIGEWELTKTTESRFERSEEGHVE